MRNNDYFEIIKEQNKELAKFRPFKSAYEMKKEIERLNNIIEKLEQENAVLKTQVVNKDKYTYGIR